MVYIDQPSNQVHVHTQCVNHGWLHFHFYCYHNLTEIFCIVNYCNVCIYYIRVHVHLNHATQLGQAS